MTSKSKICSNCGRPEATPSDRNTNLPSTFVCRCKRQDSFGEQVITQRFKQQTIVEYCAEEDQYTTDWHVTKLEPPVTVPEPVEENPPEEDQETYTDDSTPSPEPRVSSRSLTIQLITSITVMVVVGVAAIITYKLEQMKSAGDDSFDTEDSHTKSKKKRKHASRSAMKKLAETDPEALLKMASDLESQGKYAIAETAYDVALEEDESDPKLFRLRGMARKMQGKYDEALNDFDRCVELNPDSADNLAARAEYYWDVDRMDNCRDDISKAISKEPDNYHVRLLSALFFISFGDQSAINAGLADANAAMKLAPNSADCLAMKALYDSRVQNEVSSQNCFKKAVERSKGNAMANYVLVYYLLPKKDWKNALSYVNKAVKLKPTYLWHVYLARGIIYSHLFEQEKSIDSFNKAIALNPKNAELFNKRSAIYLELNRKDEALKDMDQAIALKPKNAYYHEVRADIEISMAKQEAAVEDCDAAISLDGGSARVYKLKGSALVDLKKEDEALVAFSKSVELSPDYEAARLARAQIYAARKQYQKAVDDYTVCLKRHPELPRALQGRAEAYEKMGKPELAKQDRSGAIKEYGNIIDAVHNAGTNFRTLLNKSENIEQAKAETKQNQ
ncbi:MAG: tetratricopeptide repeat protein [Cyanobacteria bacterium]|nr:tetratricopeptide repeat protein [Cyanobacteriota bacterium]